MARARRMFALASLAAALGACGGGGSDAASDGGAVGESPAPAPTTGSPAPAPGPAAAPGAPAPATPAPAPAQTTEEIVSNWVTVANEDFPSFTLNGTARFGKGKGWVSRDFNGAGQCNSQGFGGADPAPGYVKECQKEVKAKNVLQTGVMPIINNALLPPAQKGFSNARIGTGANFEAGPYDIGAFRTTCSVSHYAFDDPIVYPGQPGRSHLHMFFGNTGANANSTAASIANSGDSTCAGGTLNRTAYWVPAMINLKTGAPVEPSSSIWYYKSGYLGVRAESVQPFPAGLRMIAGDAARKTPADSAIIRIHCGNGTNTGGQIPNCSVGDTVAITIIFPQCWDGKNLDSPDHKSHMAYASNGCPSSHPVPLPEISLNIEFPVTESRPDQNWKLSSDSYSGTGGYSMHADWFDGWNEDIMKTFVSRCINTRASSSNAICDGRYLQ